MASAAQNTPISAFLVTRNEARHIGAVLDALQAFDEIILVDSGSTDETVAIAKAKGAKVFHRQWLGFAHQKNYAMGLCRNPWVLNVDGDEILPAGLAREIQQQVNQAKAAALRLYFEDIFWGEPMSPHSGKRSIVRVFRKDLATYPLDRRVHENLVLAKGEKEAQVKGLVTHFGYETTELLMSKQNQYSSLKALEKFEKRRKPSLLKLSLIFPLTLIKAYFFQRMFLSGKRGLVHAYIEAMYAFLKEAKLFEYWETRDKS
ncbi:glycosyltransferase family 2 protein [Shewanella salipaludis]|uniref:Glycosyltransferase family 2 protein n=1 Tax=Shewanella salipaludis TaxID=2723052 RepID=A0A972FWT0_9GAMM|nr:glycosyltransferase family 2 protein [Shewanella salipaludis]NMH66694.1 glycosyltransferase family 2 protein [Shewanella salipaludis]